MSAYLIDNETISKIANTLVKQSLSRNPRSPTFEKLSGIVGRNKRELAEEIYNLNCHALDERYGTKSEEMKSDFEYEKRLFSIQEDKELAQFHMSLSSLIYQCSEGDAINKRIYKQLREARNILARFIAHRWASEQGAEWK